MMRHRHRGFTLIELMIGLTISLMGLMAVGQMMLNFSKKRTSITQTLAAQDNGVMALYRLERDLSQAGYGLMPLQSCASITNALTAGADDFTPYPVVITDGGSGASDMITVKGTNTTSGVPGTELDGSSGATMTTSAYNVRSTLGFAINDMVAATIPDVSGNCAMTRLTAVGATTLSYTPAQTGSSTAGYLVYFGGSSSDVPTSLFNRQYAVGAQALTVADYPAFVTNNLVDNIVFLKAQYGLSATTTTTAVTSWVSGATAITANNVNRVVAIRVGVVARSAASDAETIDQPNPVTVLPAVTDAGGTTIGAAETFTLPDTKLRYRAYSTIIPLKNVLWTR